MFPVTVYIPQATLPFPRYLSSSPSKNARRSELTLLHFIEIGVENGTYRGCKLREKGLTSIVIGDLAEEWYLPLLDRAPRARTTRRLPEHLAVLPAPDRGTSCGELQDAFGRLGCKCRRGEKVDGGNIRRWAGSRTWGRPDDRMARGGISS
ncbi:hypothetical protein OG21DRAFT_983709 [Imleria badia]|nr:hypothetical protein OG21DRAFT_983709 [Imleria badia]